MVKRSQDAVAVFSTPRMSLVGRAQKLRNKLSELEGIREIDINYILDTVSVSYDSEKVELVEIRRKLDAF